MDSCLEVKVFGGETFRKKADSNPAFFTGERLLAKSKNKLRYLFFIAENRLLISQISDMISPSGLFPISDACRH